MSNKPRPLTTLLLLLPSLTLAHGTAPHLDAGPLTIEIAPESPTTDTTIHLEFVGTECYWVTREALSIDSEAGTARLAYLYNSAAFSGPCMFSTQQTLSLATFPKSGTYEVTVFETSGSNDPDPFSEDNLIGALDVDVTVASTTAYPETPAEGSIQSGIGLIRGWACDAQSVQVQFDSLPRIAIPYGSTRTDTEGICGDSDNGYGYVMAWGSLGEGMHLMRTWIDGALVGSIMFEVTGLDDPFVTGLSGTYVLEDFPAPGETVTVEWSEPDQNFIIVEHNP